MVKSTKGRITLSLPKDMLDRLNSLAEADHRTVSNYIEVIVHQHLQRIDRVDLSAPLDSFRDA
jgi:predicted DNA-binding protein